MKMRKLLYKVQTRFLFNAHIKIKIPEQYGNYIFDILFGVMEEVDRLYNSYKLGSSFYKINACAGNFVEVDDATIKILKTIIHFSNFFDGRYDITIMPLLRLWGFYKDGVKNFPSANELEHARSLVNYKDIQLDGNRVRINQGQEIITGSFIKAYAADRVKEKIEQLGITDALINAGGSTIIGINNEDHPFWQIIVREPKNKARLFLLNISNQCFSTSKQCTSEVDIAGAKYGYILNPSTGYPSKNKHIGIITEDCFTGDMASTGLFNETPDGFIEKIRLLSIHHKIDGFLIDDQNEVTCSPEFVIKYVN